MNQRSCAAVAVDGYTLASHVAFVRSGQIVDEIQAIQNRRFDLIIEWIDESTKALESIEFALKDLDRRVRELQNER